MKFHYYEEERDKTNMNSEIEPLSTSSERQIINLINDLKLVENQFPELKNKKLNIFEAAGLIRQEIRHSRVLANLLDPRENHGLSDIFIKELITHNEIQSSLDDSLALKLAFCNYDDLVVRTEEMNIDILAWSPKNKLLIAIENKIGASEGKGQLTKYSAKLNNDSRFKEYDLIFLYLTIDGDSGSDKTWYPISHAVIEECIGNILEIEKIEIETKLFLSHYVELIRRHILNMQNEELKAACANVYAKHKAILDVIFENVDIGGSKAEAIKRFIEEHNKEIVTNIYNNNWLSFNFNEVVKELVDVELSRQWHNQKKPVTMFFNFHDDKIKLVIEVGPMKDTELRKKFVIEMFKNLRNKDAGAKSDIYTRVLSKSVKIDDLDEIGVDSILKKMNALFDDFKNHKESILSAAKQVGLCKAGD